jgi:flagellar basal body-associated protein FliL
MCRIIIILLGGMLAMLVAAGATTIAYKITKPEIAQQRVVPAGPVDPTLTKHLRDSWEEMALP